MCMNDIKISDRLKHVAKCVIKGAKVADIGCDHAYTAIYLIKNNIADNVVALDINKGPLQKANENIEKYGCGDKIITRLSDGAKKLKSEEVDTLLISGMGGRLTIKILEDSLDIVKTCRQLVLQPQSEIHLVREYLGNIGYSIKYEDMLIDEGKYYVIISAFNEYDRNNNTVLRNDLENKVFNYYGEYLLKEKNNVLYNYLLKKLQKNNDISKAMLAYGSNITKNNERLIKLNEEEKLIREGLKYYEM